MQSKQGLKVAVVGGGVAGIVSAYLLQRKHQVTIFEANDYLGGHTNTVLVEDPDLKELAVDTGFIVLNDKNYPLLHKFLSQLNVPWRWSDMSFGYYDEESNFSYAGTTLSGLFSERRHLFSTEFWNFLFEIKRFCKVTKNAYLNEELNNLSVQEFLRKHKFSDFFTRSYLVPMAAAIWSASQNEILNFPALLLARFFHNHGLLGLKDRPRWQTVVGGSWSYVNAFRESFNGEVLLSSAVKSVIRSPNAATVILEDGSQHRFDCVVIALHADKALSVLSQATDRERRLLGTFSYQNNHTVLHFDDSALPPNHRAWASWNYYRRKNVAADKPIQVTYHMNRLQGLKSKRNYCVTLNGGSAIDPSKVIAEFNYTHPCFSLDSLNAQAELSTLNNQHDANISDTYFCGSYFGNGFHEDAVRSAVAVGKCFGEEL